MSADQLEATDERLIQGPVTQPDQVILVALQFHGVDRREALQAAEDALSWLPTAPWLVGHWVAEDDRFTDQDEDSAVFCFKGQQRLASATLIETGVSREVNLRG
jgi:hypothetical protein